MRHDRKEILGTNYDDGPNIANSPNVAAKADYVVEIRVDKNEVEKVSNVRDVYLRRGGDLDLNKYEHKIQKTPNPKNRFAYT